MRSFLRRHWLTLAVIGASTFLAGSERAQAADQVDVAKIRIVACDAQVQSHKRGVAANQLGDADFGALAPGVSWWYDWFYKPNQQPPAGVDMKFVPMVWGNRESDLHGLEAYLAAGHKPPAVMAVNEPNLKDQAYITPEQTAELLKKTKAIADKYGIPVTGPHMALGSGKDASITAEDPLEHKPVTYTYMVPFVKAVDHYLGDVKMAGVGYHTYGAIGEMTWSVGEAHKQFGAPLWVTEFAWWNAPDLQAERTYMMQATDLLERSPDVAAYAWFKERADNPKISLLEKEPGKLSMLGQTYVAMPVHDADVYYQLPGRLGAERYVTMEDAQIYPSSDTDGFAQMATTAAGGWLAYHVVVPKTGRYEVTVRVSGAAGTVTLTQEGKVLATFAPEDNQWQTVHAEAELTKGPQTLRLTAGASGQTFNWMAVAAR